MSVTKNIVGDYNTISVEQIVSSCKQRLRLETSDDDIFLERYANEGARHFDSLSTFVKRCAELEVVNGKAKLPNGFYQTLAVGGCNGGEYFYVDTPFLSSCGVGFPQNFISSQGVFQIQNGWIYLTAQANFSNNHGTSVLGTSTDPCPPKTTSVSTGPVFLTNKIRIWFIGMNVDDNGMMVVYSDMERGLVAYCVWMYMLDAPAGKYSQMQIEANHAIWVNQKKWYQSIQFQNNFRNTRRQVAAITNAFIVKKEWYI